MLPITVVKIFKMMYILTQNLKYYCSFADDRNCRLRSSSTNSGHMSASRVRVNKSSWWFGVDRRSIFN